jgi:hypothetical protein
MLYVEKAASEACNELSELDELDEADQKLCLSSQR